MKLLGKDSRMQNSRFSRETRFGIMLAVILIFTVLLTRTAWADTNQSVETTPVNPEAAFLNVEAQNEYPIGVDDVLEISVIQPDQITHVVRVSPDGFISFPFIGSVKVKGLTLSGIQEKITSELENGFLKYPVVYVSLIESRSRKFFVYGEVEAPGAFPLEENTTILRAISMAGGFTRFGSSSGVKVLSPRKGNNGYESARVNIKKILNGDPEADILIMPGDILVVSGGMF